MKSESKICGQITCGRDQTCSPDGQKCVSEVALAACTGVGIPDGDACSSLDVPTGVCDGGVCTFSGCGNNILEPKAGEVCDDGNRISGDGCNALCTSKEQCGDGILDRSVGELCDCGTDPNNLPPGCTTVNSDDPNASCRPEHAGQAADPLKCTPSTCGDGIVDTLAGETCDDSNNEPGDGCAADCSGRWTVMQSNTFADLKGVWAASATDAWAVGNHRVMRWDGSAWYRQPEKDATLRNYTSVCGISPTDVFVTADDKILHYQGAGTNGTWSEVTPAQSNWTWLFCRGGMAWAAGLNTSSNRPAWAKWNGTFFVASTFTISAFALVDIWSSTDGDLFGIDSGGAIYKADSDFINWNPFGGGFGFGTNAKHLTGTTSSELTVTTNTGALRHTTTWELIPGSDDVINAAITAVPNTTPTQMLLVGPSGSIMVCTAAGCVATPSRSEHTLTAVSAVDANHAFIVGDHGTILY